MKSANHVSIENLQELFDAMKIGDQSTLDHFGHWSSALPTFGGDSPKDTSGIWSWDATHMIVGVSCRDLEIVSRENYVS